MLRAIAPAEMKRMEREAMEKYGIPSPVLMEHAARSVERAVRRRMKGRAGRVLFICGTGNNGGDGLAAARLYISGGGAASVWLLAGRLSPDAETQLNWLRALAPHAPIDIADENTALPEDAALVVDAMFGTGLSRPLSGAALAACRKVNESGLDVIAVDIPSGLCGDTGYALPGGDAVRCVETVTFHRPKLGLYLGDGPDICGDITVCDIQLPDEGGGVSVMEEADIASLPRRRRNTHKGDHGRVLCVAGSRGMAGAAGICAMSALRAGAGLVTVACVEEIMPVVQALCPCATCLPLPPDAKAAWDILLPALSRADCLAMGCGLGESAFAREIVLYALEYLKNSGLSAVIDADALNIMSGMDGDMGLSARHVLTPHMGEAARLLGISPGEVARKQLGSAKAIMKKYGASVMLKGASTVVVSGDGTAINVVGTPAMAKGGSGDALTGVAAAMLASREEAGRSILLSLQTAACLHGMAGKRAAEALGERAALATDLARFLGA